MYRNITYRVDQDFNGTINLYTWDKDGNRVLEHHKHESYLTYEVPYETDLKSIYETFVKRRYFQNKNLRRRFAANNSTNKYIENQKPEIEFLKSHFFKQNASDDFSKFKFRLHYIDIEIAVGFSKHYNLNHAIKIKDKSGNVSEIGLYTFESTYDKTNEYEVFDEKDKTWKIFKNSCYRGEDEFPNPMDALYPINLITVYDTEHKKYFCWALGDVAPHREDVEVFIFDREVHLLDSYLNWHQKNMPDALTGWNILRFDIPYIINRAERILDDEHSKRISPEFQYYVQTKVDNQTEEEYQRHHIMGLTQFDYLVLYRDKFGKSCPTGYSLGAVGQYELGLNKLEFDGSYRDIWKMDFQKYFEYNIRDVEILVKLDDKLELIKLARKICNIGLVPYENIYSSIPYLTHALSLFAKEKFNVVFPVEADEDAENEKYEGAYVMEPTPGYYDQGVVGVDVNSLYPNTVIALNISPETKFGKVLKSGDEYVINTNRGKSLHVNKEKLAHLLNTKFTISKNNVLFLKPSVKAGVVSEFLKYYYAERLKVKSRTKGIDRKIEACEDPIEAERLKLQYSNSKTLDNCIKVILNSVYGMFGTKYSSLFDVECAEAITLTGQFIIKTAYEYINTHFRDTYGVQGDSCVYGDTDSSYYNVAPLVHTYLKTVGKTDLIECSRTDIKKICEKVDDFVENGLIPHCQQTLAKHTFSESSDRIKFSREIFAREFAVFRKKRYFAHVIDEEGKACDKFKYTGVELKQNALPLAVKEILRDVYETSCNERWTFDKYYSRISTLWDKFKLLDWEDVAYYKGYNSHKEAVGFMNMQKGTTGTSKAAAYYNQMLEKFGLLNKYEKSKPGDRIRLVYIKPNRYGINVMAFLDRFPDEFRTEFCIDYSVMFQKMITKPLSTYCKLLNWRPFDPNAQPELDIFLLQ